MDGPCTPPVSTRTHFQFCPSRYPEAMTTTSPADTEHAAACVAACEGIHPAAVPLLLAACKRVLAELRDGGDITVGAEEDLEDALNVAAGEVG